MGLSSWHDVLAQGYALRQTSRELTEPDLVFFCFFVKFCLWFFCSCNVCFLLVRIKQLAGKIVSAVSGWVNRSLIGHLDKSF